MDHRSLANQLLAGFGRLLAVDELKLNAEDRCVLVLNHDLVLTIELDDAGQMVFSIPVDTIPGGRAEPLLRELLAANRYWLQTEGATLGIQNASGIVVAMHARPVIALDDSAFAQLVEDLLNVAAQWRGRIAAYRASTSISSMPDITSTTKSEPPLTYV